MVWRPVGKNEQQEASMRIGYVLWIFFTIFWDGVMLYAGDGLGILNLLVFGPLLGLATSATLIQGCAGIWLAWHGQELLEELWEGLTYHDRRRRRR
jgi:hypothetical protein